MNAYRIGIGYGGIALKYYEARSLGLRLYFHPDYGYDHIEVKRLISKKEVKK